MEITSKELKENIKMIVDSFNNETKSKIYNLFLFDDERMIPIPEVVKMIVFDMFVNEFDLEKSSDELRYCYKTIHNYTLELQKVGYVTFLN